jgi:hypothetical protein
VRKAVRAPRALTDAGRPATLVLDAHAPEDFGLSVLEHRDRPLGARLLARG